MLQPKHLRGKRIAGNMIRILTHVRREADRRYPYGYAAFEALYVTFRALVLLGIMVFAALGAVGKIYTYLRGGEIPELSCRARRADPCAGTPHRSTLRAA